MHVHDTYYATLAQTVPVLVLGLGFEAGWLARRYTASARGTTVQLGVFVYLLVAEVHCLRALYTGGSPGWFAHSYLELPAIPIGLAALFAPLIASRALVPDPRGVAVATAVAAGSLFAVVPAAVASVVAVVLVALIAAAVIESHRA